MHLVEEAREALLRYCTERAVIAAKAVFNGADQILNLGKSANTDPFLVSTVLSVRLPLFFRFADQTVEQLLERTCTSSHCRDSRSRDDDGNSRKSKA